MRRYIIAAALIGLVSSGLILVLSGLGLFAQPSRWLAHVFGAAGIFPRDGGVVVAWFVPILTIVVAFGVAWCAVDIPEVGQKLLVFLTTLVVVSGVALSAALFGIMVEPFSALSGATLAAGAGLFYASTEPGRRKRVLQTVLGNRISRSSFHRLLNRRDPIDFKGVSRDATVLTFRILSCSEAQDSMSPSDTVAMTNLYLRNIADFLLERGAYLDESSPDCVRVFFGLLEEDERHAEYACRAALELGLRLRNLDTECENRYFRRLHHGVAVCSGRITMGIYGSPRHFFLSAIGGEIDYCRRLSRANLIYQSQVIIGASTYARASELLEIRPLEMFYDPDVHQMTEIYELLALAGGLGSLQKVRRDAFWEGVIHYRAGRYEEAIERFVVSKPPDVADPPVSYFLEQAQNRLGRVARGLPSDDSDLVTKGHARLLGSL
ncbi:MAG: adenylate/guanylate cyclase domain-containing protein [Verrucomicrobiales bacterium]|nr:hypothetical protein [Verrucomicrobiae bacterium]MCP5555493.1 hypothetical protein [Akkermansiaceae bacterium]